MERKYTTSKVSFNDVVVVVGIAVVVTVVVVVFVVDDHDDDGNEKATFFAQLNLKNIIYKTDFLLNRKY